MLKNQLKDWNTWLGHQMDNSKLVYPPGKPGDAVLKNDKNYYLTVVHITTMYHLTQSVQVTQHTGSDLEENGNFKG